MSSTSPFKHLVSPILKKQTKQQTQALPTIRVHSVSSRVSFLPFTVKFLKKKKSFVFTILQRPPFCLKLKVTDDILVDKHTVSATPHKQPIFEPHHQALLPATESLLSFIGSYSVCPLRAFLPVRHLPFALSLLAEILSVHEMVSSHGRSSKSLVRTAYSDMMTTGFRKTSQGGGSDGQRKLKKILEASMGYQLLLALLRSPLLGHIHLLGFLITLVPKLVME